MTGRPRAAGPPVLVVGEALIDVVHRRDGSVDEAPGGSPANVAIALGRLGRRVAFASHIGDDHHGRAVERWLEASGVHLATGRTTEHRTSTATARLAEDGSASYEFDLDWRIDEVIHAPAGFLHTGSIAALRDPGAPTVLDLIEARRLRATISYDPNIRPSVIDTPSVARERAGRMIAHADLVKASDEDIRWLRPGASLLQVAQEWQRSGPAVVIVTRGGDGAFAVTSAGTVSVDAERTDVVDTVGAGDTFMASLIDSALRLGAIGPRGREVLATISQSDVEAMLARAAHAAAVTVSREGADPPWAWELSSGAAAADTTAATA